MSTTTTRKRVQTSELIRKGLATLPDDFILAERKDTDNGLKRLLEEYEDCTSRNSAYESINSIQTGRDLKTAMSKMTFEEQMEIIYGYLVAVGRVEEHLDYDKEVKRFRFRFLKWGAFSLLFLFVATVGGVVAAGVIRNDIDSNEFLKMFMGLVNTATEIWFTGKPHVE